MFLGDRERAVRLERRRERPAPNKKNRSLRSLRIRTRVSGAPFGEPGRSLREAGAALKSSLSRAAIEGSGALFGRNTKGAPKERKGALFFVVPPSAKREFLPGYAETAYARAGAPRAGFLRVGLRETPRPALRPA